MDKSRSVNGIAGHALVLGGSGGLGAEIVRTLAASGASALSFTYGRNKKAADDLTAELRAEGIKAFAARADLSDEPGFNKVLDDAVASVGQEISLAINSIGISPNVPIEEQTLDGPTAGACSKSTCSAASSAREQLRSNIAIHKAWKVRSADSA